MKVMNLVWKKNDRNKLYLYKKKKKNQISFKQMQRKQCAAKTKKGEDCSRKASIGIYCAQHVREEEIMSAHLDVPMTRVCVNHTKVQIKTGPEGQQLADIGTTERTCMDVPSALVNSGSFDPTSLSQKFASLKLAKGPKLIV
jgi:hypothetical protein